MFIPCIFGVFLLHFSSFVSLNLKIFNPLSNFFNLIKGLGYVELNLDYCEQVESDKENCVDWSDLRVKKLNKTFRGIVGTTIFNVEFGNEFFLSGTAYVKQGGEYRMMPFKLPEIPFCDIVRDDFYYYDAIAAQSDLPQPFSCPMPKVFDLHILDILHNSVFLGKLYDSWLYASLTEISRCYTANW